MPSSRSPRFLSFSVSKLSRAKKKSFAREAAYISRTRLVNTGTGRIHDHSKKGGLLGLGMVGWKGTVEEFASTARRAEKRCDAVEGRLAIAALPSELDDKTCLGLLGNLAQHLVKKYKVGVLFALHEPDPGGDPRNKHGHLIYSSREVGENGKSLGKKTRQWDSKKDGPQCIKDLRAWWSATLNAALEKAGVEPNVELRSHAQLGIKRDPKEEPKHDGIVRTAIRRRERKMVNEFHASHSLSGNFMRLSEPELKPSVAAQTTEAPVPADAAPITAAAPVDDIPEPEVASGPIAGPGLRPLPEPKFQPSVLAQTTEAPVTADTAPAAAAAPVKDVQESEIARQPTTGRGLRRLPEPKRQPGAQPTQAPVPAGMAPTAAAAAVQGAPELEVASGPIAVPGLRPLPEPKFQPSVLAQTTEAPVPADTAPAAAAAPVKDVPESEIAPQPTAGRGLRRLPEPKQEPSGTVHEIAASDLATAGPVDTDAPPPGVPEATQEPPLRRLRRLPEPQGGGLPPPGPTGPSPRQ